MEKIADQAEELAGHLKEYVNSRIESVKLGVAEKSSAVIANLVAGAAVAALFFFFLVFAGIAGGILLGIWVGKAWLGFLIMAGIYLLLAIIIWAGRTRLIRLPVMNAMIRQLFNKEEEEDEDEAY